jgi:hypothetical protein
VTQALGDIFLCSPESRMVFVVIDFLEASTILDQSVLVYQVINIA